MFNYFWALDVPDSYPKAPQTEIFKDKCLLTACILGLLQNKYFKTNRQDKTFQKAQYINSTLMSHKNIAGKIILEELIEMQANCNLPITGPYDLILTSEILSKTYNCQIIVFDGISNSRKISYMYPSIYNDELIPIYLYEPLECPGHFVFIRNLNSYFNSNVKVCLGCQKSFKSRRVKHLCNKKKTCFSCRRFFHSEKTYLHEKLEKLFCNKNTTTEKSFLCSKCNVTVYSKHCFIGHKLFCYGNKMSFGWKCNQCNVFTYKGSNSVTNHICGQLKTCKFCFTQQESDHLCKLKQEVVNNNWPRIAFIGTSSYETLPDKCFTCLTNGECKIHKNIEKDYELEVFLVIIYREDIKRGHFSKYIISPDLNLNEKIENNFIFDYFEKIEQYPFQKFNKSKKQTTDFERNYEKLMSPAPREESSLMSLLLKLIMDKNYANTTYICQGNDSTSFVSSYTNNEGSNFHIMTS